MFCCGKVLPDIVEIDTGKFQPGRACVVTVELGRRKKREKSDIFSEIHIGPYPLGEAQVSKYQGLGHTRLSDDETWERIEEALEREGHNPDLAQGLVAVAIRREAEGFYSSPSVSPATSRSTSPVPE